MPCDPRSTTSSTASPNVIGDILVTSRSMTEYSAMFALSPADLRRRILDCPGGTASFTAEVCAAGGDVTACDPVYGQYTADELTALGQRDTERGNHYCRTHSDEYMWTFFTDPEHHSSSRSASGNRFADHHRAHPERYVAGALPRLSFTDERFDLVLSSHFLFSYEDRLDLSFHHRAVRELMRVAATEVRIFPLVGMGSSRYPNLEVLRGRLADDGITTEIRSVDYEFQIGGNEMLVCSRDSAPSVEQR
ncbi:class I SAM-dependent methyltransferase [Rhodococcus sp. HNM0563]|nr:class I SAM-dependent methyltransferase [Rhodococcus sp. HNM0563]